jgi:hypothetical protein
VQGSGSMTVYIQKWLHRPVFNCTCPSPSYWSFKFNEFYNHCEKSFGDDFINQAKVEQTTLDAKQFPGLQEFNTIHAANQTKLGAERMITGSD